MGRLGTRQGKVWDVVWRRLAGVGYFGPTIKFIGLFTGLSCMIFLGIEAWSGEISRVWVSPYLSSFARGSSYAAHCIA